MGTVSIQMLAANSGTPVGTQPPFHKEFIYTWSSFKMALFNVTSN